MSIQNIIYPSYNPTHTSIIHIFYLIFTCSTSCYTLPHPLIVSLNHRHTKPHLNHHKPPLKHPKLIPPPKPTYTYYKKHPPNINYARPNPHPNPNQPNLKPTRPPRPTPPPNRLYHTHPLGTQILQPRKTNNLRSTSILSLPPHINSPLVTILF
jgi:hypothetical protein